MKILSVILPLLLSIAYTIYACKFLGSSSFWKWLLTGYLFLVCGLCSLNAQTIQIQTGTNLGDMKQIAFTGGYISPINGSTFTGGIVRKLYKDAHRTGFRLDVQIPIGEWAHFSTLTDAFLKPVNDARATFLEIGAGLGATHKNFALRALYQMNDFHPVLKLDREDQILLILQYRLVWNQ